MFNTVKADIAFKEDRERFFKEADKYNNDYLKNQLTTAQQKALENAKEEWRNMTDLENYPDIDFPLSVPDFMKVKLFSSHKKGENITKQKDPDFN